MTGESLERVEFTLTSKHFEIKTMRPNRELGSALKSTKSRYRKRKTYQNNCLENMYCKGTRTSGYGADKETEDDMPGQVG